jgi:hypothetical protein
MIFYLLKIPICAIFYRLGGEGYGRRPFRIAGIPLIVLLYLGWIEFHWLLLLTCGLMAGAISTYWNKKDAKETFKNYYLHGLGIAVAFMPYEIMTGDLIWYSVRIILLPLLIGFWATKMNRPIWKFRSDVVSECGRGGLIGMFF